MLQDMARQFPKQHDRSGGPLGTTCSILDGRITYHPDTGRVDYICELHHHNFSGDHRWYRTVIYVNGPENLPLQRVTIKEDDFRNARGNRHDFQIEDHFFVEEHLRSFVHHIYFDTRMRVSPNFDFHDTVNMLDVTNAIVDMKLSPGSIETERRFSQFRTSAVNESRSDQSLTTTIGFEWETHRTAEVRVLGDGMMLPGRVKEQVERMVNRNFPMRHVTIQLPEGGIIPADRAHSYQAAIEFSSIERSGFSTTLALTVKPGCRMGVCTIVRNCKVNVPTARWCAKPFAASIWASGGSKGSAASTTTSTQNIRSQSFPPGASLCASKGRQTASCRCTPFKCWGRSCPFSEQDPPCTSSTTPPATA